VNLGKICAFLAFSTVTKSPCPKSVEPQHPW